MRASKSDLISLLNGPRTPIISADFDWDRILAMADHARVSPLLFYRLKSLKKEINMPDRVYRILKRAYQINLIKNTLAREEFDKLCSHFEKEGLSLILLKGILFSLTIYTDWPGLRQMEDIDILIRETDLEEAESLLESQGYQAYGKATERNRKAAIYVKKAADSSICLPIHLHWHIITLSLPLLTVVNWPKIDMADIWQCVQTIDKSRSHIFMMCPEHMLLALSEHGLRHGFYRMDILYDLHSYIQQYRNLTSWPKLAALARRWGLEVPLYIGLFFSQKMFHTDLPDEFLRDLRPEGLSFLEKYLITYIGRKDFPREEICVLLYLAINRRLADKIKFLQNSFGLKLSRQFGFLRSWASRKSNDCVQSQGIV